MWEVRVALGPDPVSGRSRGRSVTVYGDLGDGQVAREQLAAAAGLVRDTTRARPGITLRDLLVEGLAADHDWRPSTASGYRSVAGFLQRDPIGSRRAGDVHPRVVRAACAHWRSAGTGEPTISGRIRCLRSALGWAHAEQILDCHPLDGMRGPAQNRVRLHAPVDQVRAVLDHAHELLLAAHAAHAAHAADPERPSPAAVVHRAEQVYLVARLAADTGARRGELAALQLADLDGDVLTIARGTSKEVVGPTKSGRIRRITLGASTATLWRDTVNGWRHLGATHGRFGPWLFSPTADHTTRLTTACLGRWFTDLTADAGYPDITLLSRPGARCRCCHRSVSPGRSPNPPCRSLGNGLSTVSAVRRGSRVATGVGSCCPGRRSERP